VLGDRVVLDSPPGGNGNGRLDPGESGGLCATLRNIGTEGLASVTGILRSGDARFTVTDSTADYGGIPADSSAINLADPFLVEVDGSVQPETPIPCTLFVSGSTDYEDTCAFAVIIGEARPVDPIPDGPRQPALYWAYDECDTGYARYPDFEWVEINTQGTRLNFSNNDAVIVVNLPSSFGPLKYYGQRYTQVSVSADGWIAAGSYTTGDYANDPLPSSAAPPAVIALNWDDLYPGYGSQGYVYWYHDAANHRFVIEYDSVPYYDTRTLKDKYQLVIYDTTMAAPDGQNELKCQYLTANGFQYSTLGIQDATKAIGIQCLYDASYHRGCSEMTPGRAILYTTDEPMTGVAEDPRGQELAGRTYCTPNPFRAGTFVHYHAAAPGPVEVAAYDATGREVDRFAFTAGQGRGSVRWNPGELARGMYFLKVSAPGEETVVKVLAID